MTSSSSMLPEKPSRHLRLESAERPAMASRPDDDALRLNGCGRPVEWSSRSGDLFKACESRRTMGLRLSFVSSELRSPADDDMTDRPGEWRGEVAAGAGVGALVGSALCSLSERTGTGRSSWSLPPSSPSSRSRASSCTAPPPGSRAPGTAEPVCRNCDSRTRAARSRSAAMARAPETLLPVSPPLTSPVPPSSMSASSSVARPICFLSCRYCKGKEEEGQH